MSSEILRLTNSEMSGFQDCRRRWWLGQYRGLQKIGAEFNRPLSVGSRMHEVLEAYYAPGRPIDPDQLLHGGVTRDLLEFPAFADDIVKEEKLVVAMWEGYQEWLEEIGVDSDLEPVTPESEVEVELIPGKATLMAKIDVQLKHLPTGKTSSIDHKSVGDLVKPKKKLHMDPQLLTQHLVQHIALMQAGDHPNETQVYELLYNMLRKVKRTPTAKPPFFDREPVKHSVPQLRSHWKHCVGEAERILEARALLDAGADHHKVCPPRVTGDCSWKCPFAAPCLAGMFDDNSDVEGYLAEHYEVVDPLDRYRSKEPAPAAVGSPQ